MRIALPAALLAILAAVTWLLLARSGGPVAPATPRAPAPHADAAIASASSQPTEDDRSPPQRAPVSASDHPRATGPEYRVRVVDADSGAPIPNAQVATWGPDGPRGRPNDDLVFDHGIVVRSGADGSAAIAGDPTGVMIASRTDGHYGRVFLRFLGGVQQRSTDDGWRPDDPATLPLERDYTLTVQVLDAQRHRVGPTDLFLEPLASGQEPVLVLGPTDEHGTWTWRHAQDLFDRPDAKTVAVMVDGFGGILAKTPLMPNGEPTENIDVVLDSGALDVVLLGPDGRPWDGAMGSAWLVHGRTLDGADSDDPNANSGSVWRSVEGPHVRIEPVSCSHTYELHVSLDGLQFEQRIEGPRHPGDVVPVELRMPADTTVVDGRVLAPDGSPYQGSLQVAFHDADSLAGALEVVLHDGRLAVPLPASKSATPPATIRMELTTIDHGSHYGRAKASCELVPGAATLHTGDIRLQETPLLVAGRAVRADGWPASFSFDIDARTPATDPTWKPLQLKYAYVDDHGHFEARGPIDDADYRLRPGGAYSTMAPIPFAAGTSDLRISLPAPVSVRARFVVDEATPWHELDFRLEPIEAAALDHDSAEIREQRSAWMRAEPETAGDDVICAWNGVPHVPLRLLVLAPHRTTPLVEIDGIEATPGGSADPRLDGIDLRGRVHTITVRVVDPDGTPIPGAMVVVHKSGDEPWYGRQADDHGVAVLLVPHPLHVSVVADGFLVAEREALLQDTTVQLQTAPTLQVQIESWTSPPLGFHSSLSVSVRDLPDGRMIVHDPPGYWVALILKAVADFPIEHGVAHVTLLHRAPYSAELLVGRDGHGVVRVPVEPATLDPTTLEDGATVTLRCDPAKVEAARQKLLAH